MGRLDESKTYSCDIPLFHKLGLTPFETNDNEKILLGECVLPFDDGASIEVSVRCMPAQFWEFNVKTVDGRQYKITTGSGTLSDFWDTVSKVAEGMIVIEQI